MTDELRGSAWLTPALAQAALPAGAQPYAVVLRHGTLEVGWYAPRASDDQQPHDRDELYVIASGTARFAVDGQGERDVASGDVLFVGAHHAHRFSRMSEHFATWVMFYGPRGGETVDAAY